MLWAMAIGAVLGSFVATLLGALWHLAAWWWTHGADDPRPSAEIIQLKDYR